MPSRPQKSSTAPPQPGAEIRALTPSRYSPGRRRHEVLKRPRRLDTVYAIHSSSHYTLQFIHNGQRLFPTSSDLIHHIYPTSSHSYNMRFTIFSLSALVATALAQATDNSTAVSVFYPLHQFLPLTLLLRSRQPPSAFTSLER